MHNLFSYRFNMHTNSLIAQNSMVSITAVVVEFCMRTGPSKSNQHTLVLPPFCPVTVAEICGSAHPEILLWTTYQSCHCWQPSWGTHFGRRQGTFLFVQLHTDHAAVHLEQSPSTPTARVWKYRLSVDVKKVQSGMNRRIIHIVQAVKCVIGTVNWEISANFRLNLARNKAGTRSSSIRSWS